VKAVVLCAGKGTRLRPLTDAIPKVMLPLGGKPVLEHHVNKLKEYGVTQIYINLHHHPEKICEYFGDGSDYGVSITYSYEDQLLGTAGALNSFRDHLDETFIVHYGDVVSELNIANMSKFHEEKQAIATLVVHPTDRPNDCDVVVMEKDCRITALYSKPGTTKFGKLGNAAYYMIEPAIFKYLPKKGAWDFVKDLFPQILKKNNHLYGYLTNEFLEDMGTFERYEKIRKRYEARDRVLKC